jgi:heme-degrading monooxygenase HmoA
MMFARMLAMATRKESLDEAIRVYQNSVIPAASQQPGFRGAVLLTDRANARGTSITFWESEEALLQNERSGYYERQVAALRPLLTGEPVRTVCEVSAQTMVQAMAGAGGSGMGATR